MQRKLPVLILLAVALVASGCSMISYQTRDLIPPEEPEVAETSRILDRNGAEITELKAEQNRIPVPLDQIAEVMQDAVVAVEDERFWLHKGVDLRGILRASVRNAAAGGISEGASTITQQYVGNVFLDRSETTANRKIEEAMLARQFEQRFTKEYILEKYLNWVYFGEGAYGVEAAAQRFFGEGTKASDLTIDQAALLAGLIQLPGTLNPYDNPEGAKERRNVVLERMYSNEYISDTELETALVAPLTLVPEVTPESEEYIAGHFIEEVKSWFLSGPPECARIPETYEDRLNLLFAGGITITTTLDPVLQRDAEIAVDTQLPILNGRGANPDAAAVTMNPATGEVLAMVGGRDFWGDDDDAKVNLATGKGRQAGSSMKPIGLAAALQKGIPVTRNFPAPSNITINTGSGPWKVKGGRGGRNITLVEATRSSTNTVFAQLITDADAISTTEFVDMAGRLGIKSPVAAVPAAILGTEDVTMLDMATAYGTFANEGLRHDPVFVSKIIDRNGTIICEPLVSAPPPVKVLDPPVARQISWVMEGVISGGTGKEAQIGRPAAGKTGTAQNFGDATFVGYTPDFVTAVWVGYPEGQISMEPPVTDEIVYGGTYPARIWREIMKAAHGDSEATPFGEPPRSTTSTTTTLFSQRPLATVPNVVGLWELEAFTAVTEAGFTPSIREVETQTQAPGSVIAQSPGGDALAPLGSVITIEVAKLPPDAKLTVPRVTGVGVADAKGILAGQGFQFRVIVEDPPGGPDPSKAGQVYRQRPAPGQVVQPGVTVRLFVHPAPVTPPPPPPPPPPPGPPAPPPPPAPPTSAAPPPPPTSGG